MKRKAPALLLLVGSLGCIAPQSPLTPRSEAQTVIVEVKIEYPDASATTVKQRIATPLTPQFSELPAAQELTTICQTGGYRAYVRTRGAEERRIREGIAASLDSIDLPAEARQPLVRTADSVPDLQTSCRARVVVDLNRRLLAALRLSAAEVRRQIPKGALTGTDNSDAVGKIRIEIPDGRSVPLAKLASLYVTCGAPDMIVETQDLR